MVRLAVVQLDPRLGAIDANMALIERAAAETAASGARLVVFPECAVTGYVYSSLAEAAEVADAVPGRVSDSLVEIAARHNLFLVAGMLERVGAQVYNAALLTGPDGIVATYRKTHLLCLGVDRFTTPGALPFAVHDLPFGRIGVLICYDLRFPETARVLALQGAQAIALPTNWPVSSVIQADVLTRARAAENHVFVLAADRVGEERGARFLGRSQIVNPDGTVLAEAGTERPEILIQDVDLGAADEKNVVVRAGEHEMDVLGDRRPDLYGWLTETL